MISKELVENIVSRVKDADLIRSSAFLLYSLSKRYPLEESLRAVKDFLSSKGWGLKTEDSDFLDNMPQKSIVDVEKWLDFNMRRL